MTLVGAALLAVLLLGGVGLFIAILVSRRRAQELRQRMAARRAQAESGTAPTPSVTTTSRSAVSQNSQQNDRQGLGALIVVAIGGALLLAVLAVFGGLCWLAWKGYSGYAALGSVIDAKTHEVTTPAIWEWGLFTIGGLIPWLGKALMFVSYWGFVILIVVLAGALVIDVRRKLRERKESKNGVKKDDDDRWFWLPFVTVEYQHTAVIYWYLFGKGNIFRTCRQGFWFKVPGLQTVVMVDNELRDRVITLPQQPTGAIRSARLPRGEDAAKTAADKDREQLQEMRKGMISGTLSFVLRITLGIRSDEEGVRQIMKSEPIYRDVMSQEVHDRIADLAAARLKNPLVQMAFEDSFSLPEEVLLLGTEDERKGDPGTDLKKPLQGVERWKDIRKDPKFKVRLTTELEVRSAALANPESLLAVIYNLGYTLSRFGIQDINPPKALENEMRARLLAEIRRDAKYTDFQSEYVDKSQAIADGRNIQAQASNYTYTQFIKQKDREYRLMHGGVLRPNGEVVGGEPLVMTGQELIEYDKFLEDRRRRSMIAEAGGQITIVDVGGDKPIPVGVNLPPRQSPAPPKPETKQPSADRDTEAGTTPKQGKKPPTGKK